ncbi:hypothetical protein NEF87_000793 [Candidatus Lokiarchaeum ossiferum]|uniref:ResB-like domain-containing protein n=1 Tax=Candidatus Lokiarchaeum ossiferum TaxID=2951803 RepID=A0ABY6HMH8_9ARCH|nr:hypothetical protein NEF87_000793 [Candidatus Lokiarchaeum sp. B-35]
MSKKETEMIVKIVARFYIIIGILGLIFCFILFQGNLLFAILQPTEEYSQQQLFYYFLYLEINFMLPVIFIFFIILGISISNKNMIGRFILIFQNFIWVGLFISYDLNQMIDIITNFSSISNNTTVSFILNIIYFILNCFVLLFFLFSRRVKSLFKNTIKDTQNSLKSNKNIEKNEAKGIILAYLVISGSFILIGGLTLNTATKKNEFEQTHYGALFETDKDSSEFSLIGQNISDDFYDRECILKNQTLIGTVSNRETNQTSIYHFQLNEDLTQLEYTNVLTIDFRRIFYSTPTIIEYSNDSYYFINFYDGIPHLLAINSLGIKFNQSISIPKEIENLIDESDMPFLDANLIQFQYLDIRNDSYNMIMRINSYEKTKATFYVRYNINDFSFISSKKIINASSFHLDNHNTLWAITSFDPIGGEAHRYSSKHQPVTSSFYGYMIDNGNLGKISKSIQHRFCWNSIFYCNITSFEKDIMGQFIFNDHIVVPYYQRFLNEGNRTKIFEGIAIYGIKPSFPNTALINFCRIHIIQGTLFFLVTILYGYSVYQKLGDKLKKVMDKTRKIPIEEIES